MAQNKTLNGAIDELMKDYKKALTIAVEYASDKAVYDIDNKAMSCLEEYYDNYEPNSYNRTDSLYRCIVPYLDIKNKGKDIVSTVGVEYDTSLLEGVYYGSKKYQPTDSAWVVSNYLEGIHPITNGSQNSEDTIYFEIRDSESPTQKMEEYLKNYVQTTFQDNLLISFVKQISQTR